MGLLYTLRTCNSKVFVVGFVIGVVLAVIFRITGNTSMKGCCLSQKRKNNYNEWLTSRGRTKELVNFDSHVYGKHSGITEATYLKNEVPILCVVFVRKVKNVKAIQDTWGKHCNAIEFIGMQNVQGSNEDGIPLVTFQPKNSFHFLCDSINHIMRKHHRIKWVLFTYDYMFVIVENLRYFVASRNPNIPYYFGHPLVFWGQIYNVAEAGYVLSNAAMKSIQEKFNSSDKCQKGGKYWKNEDFYLGKHLADMGIVPEDTRDKKSNRFHSYHFNQLLFPSRLSKSSSYWKKSLHPYAKGFNCCSNKSITFHSVDSDKLYMLDYFVQHLKVFNIPARFGNSPPSRRSDDEVVKEFLKSQGLEYEDISSKEYFELWISKLSDPDAFNERIRQEHMRNFETTAFDFVNMPHVLESMLNAMRGNETEIN